MKERFNVEIVDISFSVVTDDGEELVRKAEATLNEDVRAVLKQMGRFSKLDAVTLCALDYCGQVLKAEAKIKNLEAQIQILEASRKGDAPVKTEKASPAPASEVKTEAPKAKAEPAPAEPVKEAPAESEPAAKDEAADDSARSRKLRQLEALLGSQLKIDLDK